MADCPTGAHVHQVGPLMLPRGGWLVMCDNDTALICLDEYTAHRVAELINAHGFVDVPDRIPDEILWAPPDAGDALIDWRLPTDPTITRPEEAP